MHGSFGLQGRRNRADAKLPTTTATATKVSMAVADRSIRFEVRLDLPLFLGNSVPL